MCRKGFMLVELLAAIGVFALIALILSGMYRTITSEIPYTSRLFNANNMLNIVLDNIQRDIDRAVGLPEEFHNYHFNNETLIIQQKDKNIIYHINNDIISRSIIDNSEVIQDDNTMHWIIPNAIIQWQLWQKSQSHNACAVEIKTAVKYEFSGIKTEKLTNAYVFFPPSSLVTEVKQ